MLAEKRIKLIEAMNLEDVCGNWEFALVLCAVVHPRRHRCTRIIESIAAGLATASLRPLRAVTVEAPVVGRR